jgi:oligopeptide transport system ATP-binding protein
MTSLDPTMKIGKQIMEVILLHQNVSKSEAYEKALKLIELVGISNPEERMKQYPHQFSGGMRQRIVIAIALACEPKILIADEPTTALDVTIQAQILDLMKDLQQKIGASVIFITHDLGVVANVADRVAVMYAGRIAEIGTADDIFYNPQHPYTWGLIASMPDLDTDGDLYAIPGTPPNLIAPPVGDAFALRSEYAMQIDFEEQPPFFEVSKTHKAATWLLHENAPEVTPPAVIIKRREKFKEV